MGISTKGAERGKAAGGRGRSARWKRERGREEGEETEGRGEDIIEGRRGRGGGMAGRSGRRGAKGEGGGGRERKKNEQRQVEMMQSLLDTVSKETRRALLRESLPGYRFPKDQDLWGRMWGVRKRRKRRRGRGETSSPDLVYKIVPAHVGELRAEDLETILVPYSATCKGQEKRHKVSPVSQEGGR